MSRCDICLQDTDNGVACEDCSPDAESLRVQLTKATADAEAHRMRCDSLAAQLEASKRSELESDRRAHEAEAALDRFVSAVAAEERQAALQTDRDAWRTRAMSALEALESISATARTLV